MRPRVKVQLRRSDWFLEIIAVAGIFLLMYQPISFQLILHNKIDFSVDSVWHTPLVGISLYLLVLVFNQFPYFGNYIVEITENNARRQYALFSQWLRLINVIVVCTFNFIIFDVIQSMKGSPDFPGLTMVIFVVSVISISFITGTVYYIKKSISIG